jgi:hypothetical protein
MACGLMRLPLLTFGVLSCFSLNLGLVGLAGFSVLGALPEDALDGDDDFGEVGGRPAGKPANKAFNHEKVSPSEMRAYRLAVLLCREHRLAVPVAKRNGCFSVR